MPSTWATSGDRSVNMSHEQVNARRSSVYVLPARPSDVLRSLEFTAFFRDYRGLPFSVETGDGWRWCSAAARLPALRVIFPTCARLDTVISDPSETSLGKVFLNGELEIQGDIAALLGIADFVFRQSGRLGGGFLSVLARASMDLSKRVRPGRRPARLPSWMSISCPSDLPQQFFQPWLGPALGHTCARFAGDEESLEAAQHRGLDKVCERLDLERGDRMLEIGCGWGSLMLHAAAHCRVDALGVASSEQQAAIASARIEQQQLGVRCTAEYRDLRIAPYPKQTFDKIADLGVFEQVGFRKLREYLTCALETLTPGGLFLADRVVRPAETAMRRRGPLDSDLFPEGELAPLSRELEAAEATGMEIRSLENVTDQYAVTLRLWIDNLQRSPQLRAGQPGSRACRRWLLYLIELATAVHAGDLEVHQILLRRPLATGRVKQASGRFAAVWEIESRRCS